VLEAEEFALLAGFFSSLFNAIHAVVNIVDVVGDNLLLEVSLY
jgi:hypothetical protein